MLGLKIKQDSAKEGRKQRENVSNTAVIEDKKLICYRIRRNIHNTISAEVFWYTATKNKCPNRDTKSVISNETMGGEKKVKFREFFSSISFE